MISRFYVLCDVCKNHHTLRIQIGHGDSQTHQFNCHRCKEPITISLELGQGCILPMVSGGMLADMESVNNEVTSFQYLSPDFVAEEQFISDQFYFGSFDFMARLMSATMPIDKDIDSLSFQDGNHLSISAAKFDWDYLQSCWRMERAGVYDIAALKLNASESYRGYSSSWKAIVFFSEKIFGGNEGLFKKIENINRQYPDEFSRLAMTYMYEWRDEFKEAHFQVFTKFFQCWDEFRQVIYYVRHGIQMPDKFVATSNNFDLVRQFYSSAQEFFAKQIRIFASLNNMESGRPFDQLKSLSLNKYLKTDNAKRRDNFIDNEIFASVSSEYDSSLRNAESHNWLRYENSKQILSYRQGGDGNQITLTYGQYLYKSALMFKQICVLIQCEYLLIMVANRDAEKLLYKN